MRNLQDLDRLDNATLLMWRWSNLVGWGLAGAGVTLMLGEATNLVTSRMTDQGQTHAGNALAILMLFFSLVAGGAVVGGRVYRSPRLVAYLGQVAVGLVWITWQLTVAHQGWDGTMVLLQVGFVSIFALIAALAADVVWNRRPRTLRHL
jgi:uncharacterized membrane protein YjjP (DUF1212 family)